MENELQKDKDNLNTLCLILMSFIKKNDLVPQWEEYFDSHIEMFKAAKNDKE